MTPTNADLRQFILNFFSDEELETLCFDYFREVRQEFTTGMIKNSKVMLLIDYCDSRGRLNDLYAALERERPTAWREKFGAPPAQKPSFSEQIAGRNPRQVFISHATADTDFAHRLRDDLLAEGWQVWIAPDSIRPGEKWVEAIDRGLETSGVFVVVLTPAAVASRWVNTEADAAVEMQHEGILAFIPLDVVPCQPKRLWRQYQYVPFRGNYEVGLATLLRRLMGKPVTPGVSSTLPQTETSVSLLRDRYVKEEQWRQLQALAHEIAAELSKDSGNDELREVYRRFNHHFGLSTYKKLPRRLFNEGLTFLTAWRAEITKTPNETSSLTVPTSPEDRALSETIAKSEDALNSVVTPKLSSARMLEEPFAKPKTFRPVARFRTTYIKGRNYDDAFSIESANGDYLGECGVGIAEQISATAPHCVTALEFWLFDKNEIRTITKVLMSKHAFFNEALKTKLAAKGELLLVRNNLTTALKTATLIVDARITELVYGAADELRPKDSCFERLTVDLLVWAEELQPNNTFTPSKSIGAEVLQPLAAFRTSYTRGWDNYDDSFSLENADGDFLGECGVGTSDTLGTASPKKVTAFEVWLFDKNDIRTVAKVLMSDHAYFDPGLRAKLAPKGEPVLARKNETFALETETLILNATISDMGYASDVEVVANSCFDHLTIELHSWSKDNTPHH